MGEIDRGMNFCHFHKFLARLEPGHSRDVVGDSADKFVHSLSEKFHWEITDFERAMCESMCGVCFNLIFRRCMRVCMCGCEYMCECVCVLCMCYVRVDFECMFSVVKHYLDIEYSARMSELICRPHATTACMKLSMLSTR